MSDDDVWYDQGEEAYAKAGKLDLEASARIRAHEVFDKLWEGSGSRKQARSEAYAWLAFRLDIPPADCHMRYMDERLCRRVITICRRASRDVVAAWALEN